MAVNSTLKNMVLCLSAVCLVCSAVLAVSYVVTKSPIEEAQIAKTNNSIAAVLPSVGDGAKQSSVVYNELEYTYYTVDGVGYAIISNVGGFSGTLSVMVGITNDGIVHNTVVLSHGETPGLGAKCTEPAFADQFKGWDPAAKSLTVKKDGGQVDAITASTITSRAYALAISQAYELFKTLNNGGQTNE